MCFVGKMFDETPRSVDITFVTPQGGRSSPMPIGYTAPPFGSQCVGEIDGKWVAMSPDEFEWTCNPKTFLWKPTGYSREYPSIEKSRNFRMSDGSQ